MPGCRRLLVLIGVLLLVAGACAGDEAAPVPADPVLLPVATAVLDARPAVIVDTDMGFDDVRALMLLLEQDDVELVAVSVAGTGVARCPQAGLNARALLDRYGRSDVPVACGASAPLQGFNTAPSAWRDEAGALAGMDLDLPDDLGEVDADELLRQTIAEHPGATVLALGPLTNLGPVLADPTVAKDVGELRIMGGAIDVGGNILSFTNFVAEFNIWIDPVAAQQVLDSGVPISLVPLDATNEVPITPATVDLFAASDSRTASLISAYYQASPLQGGLYHWDDLAVASLLDPAVVTFEPMSLAINTDAESDEYGRTVRTATEAGTSVSVAMSADRERFETLLFDELASNPSTTSGRWTPDATIAFDGTDCAYEGPDPMPQHLEVSVVNSSSAPVLGVIVGVYDPGTTLQDVANYAEFETNRPPPYFDLLSVMAMPTDTTAVWVLSDLPTDVTISCAIEFNDVREVAGQRLPS